MMIYCRGCGETKPHSHFYASYLNEDRGECKECVKSRMAGLRKSNVKQYTKAKRRYRAANKEKIKAHRAVEYAVKYGRLKKPENCEECGCRPKQLDGHHDDYSKPLSVKWLCPACHAKEHTCQPA